MQFSETDTANDVKTRSRYELKSFRGVDTTSAPSEVATTRATYMQNFINRDGTNHKRYGWCEDLKGRINGKVLSTFNANIDGSNATFYEYLDTDLQKVDIKVVYKDDNGKEQTLSFEEYHYDLEESECQFYYSNGKVYIIGCGCFLCCGVFDTAKGLELKRIEDVAFAPLVYTGISANGEDTSVLKTEALYDYNLLTNNVKFGLRGIEDNTKSESGTYYTLPHKCSFNESSYVLVNDTKYTPKLETTKVEKAHSGGQGSYIAKNGERYVTSLSFSLDNLRQYEKNRKTGVEAYFSNNATLYWKYETQTISNHECDSVLYLDYKDVNGDEQHKICGGISSTKNITNVFGTAIKYGSYMEKSVDISDMVLDSNNEIYITVKFTEIGGNLSIYGTFPSSVSGDFVDESGNIKGNLNGKTLRFNQYVTLFDSTKNVSGETNIFVQCYDEEYKPKYNLNEAKFSCLFGADGACDRIFLSGVKLTNQESENDNGMECPNLVFWSEISDNVNFENNAFSYFPETSYATIGATQNAVTGMTRLNDSTLAIFREKQVGENNFSILTATYTSINSYTIGTTEYEEPVLKVSVASANMPQTAINNNCFGALANDVLFASDMGVYAIAISTGTSVERYALERSEPISNMFEYLDMANAKAIVYKNKYYLAAKYTKDDNTKEDIVLIADARYSYSLDRNMDDTYNYEWYMWTNCPVQKWIIEDDKLGFFDYDGRKCFFEKDNFVDMFYLEAKSITADRNNSEIVYSIDENLVGKTFAVLKGLKYLDTKEDVPVEDAKKLVFKFEFAYISGLNNKATNMYRLTLNDEKTDYYIDCWNNNNSVQIVDASCVEALWFTPTLDLGASDYRKTLFKLSIGLDHKSHGKVAVGWKTRYDLNQSCASIDVKNAKEFSFDDLDFTTLTFGSEFDSSYTTNLKLRDFTYLQLFFGSNDASDIAVNNIVMLYKYNKFNGGNW